MKVLSLKWALKHVNIYSLQSGCFSGHSTWAGTSPLLVMGNEPMWENWNAGLQDDDADDYKAFLNEFADRLAQWKSEEGWTFEVFAGSLNRISEVQRPTIQAVMDVVNENPNVDGLDLHLHCRNINQAEDDLRLARKKYGVTKNSSAQSFPW